VTMHGNSPMRPDTASPIHTTGTDHGICLSLANKHGCEESSEREHSYYQQA
jgi:hypothetical protein